MSPVDFRRKEAGAPGEAMLIPMSPRRLEKRPRINLEILLDEQSLTTERTTAFRAEILRFDGEQAEFSNRKAHLIGKLDALEKQIALAQGSLHCRPIRNGARPP